MENWDAHVVVAIVLPVDVLHLLLPIETELVFEHSPTIVRDVVAVILVRLIEGCLEV